MSSMKWTFKGVKNAFTPTGKPITVTEYEKYISSRGGGESTTTEYYEGEVSQDKSSMGQFNQPKAKILQLGKDFVLENPNKPIKDNKWLIYGIIAVAGYLAYKKFKK